MPTTLKPNPNGVCLKLLKFVEAVAFRDAKMVDHLVAVVVAVAIGGTGGEENKV